MKPKDLKFPFPWEERRPALYQGILIVPQYYDRHEEWEERHHYLPQERPIAIEYCSGNGDWILEKAEQEPDFLWIAVEMQFERVRKIWSKRENAKRDNLLIVCGEALTFSRYYLPDSCIKKVFVNFPDPWPKDRHAKHRLIQPPFVAELARIVEGGGTATFATDDSTYSKQMIETMEGNEQWRSHFPKPYFVKNWENYGNSWFQNLWTEKGREFFYIHYEQVDNARCELCQ